MTKTANMFLFVATIAILFASPLATGNVFAADKNDGKDSDKNQPSTLAAFCAKMDDKNGFPALVCTAIANLETEIHNISLTPGPAGKNGTNGTTGPQGPAGPQGPQGTAGSGGSTAAVYTIPGSGGTSGGGYLKVVTANGHAELDLTCNYGFAGDNEAFWFADNPSVTPGSIQILNQVTQTSGTNLQSFNDLGYNLGGQDRAFPPTSQGTWPWSGTFTAIEGSNVSQFQVTVTGSSGNNCQVSLVSSGLGSASIVHP